MRVGILVNLGAITVRAILPFAHPVPPNCFGGPLWSWSMESLKISAIKTPISHARDLLVSTLQNVLSTTFCPLYQNPATLRRFSAFFSTITLTMTIMDLAKRFGASGCTNGEMARQSSIRTEKTAIFVIIRANIGPTKHQPAS